MKNKKKLCEFSYFKNMTNFEVILLEHFKLTRTNISDTIYIPIFAYTCNIKKIFGLDNWLMPSNSSVCPFHFNTFEVSLFLKYFKNDLNYNFIKIQPSFIGNRF